MLRAVHVHIIIKFTLTKMETYPGCLHSGLLQISALVVWYTTGHAKVNLNKGLGFGLVT